MPATKTGHSVAAHFTKAAPAVRATYVAILRAARTLGPVHEDPKKTSIHLVRETAFAGVATRKDSLILTLKAASRPKSTRVERSEKTSANRWHFEVRLRSASDIDRELRAWIAEAYALAG